MQIDPPAVLTETGDIRKEKRDMGNEKNVHTLIERAWGQIAGWRHRPIPRAAWHTADDIMVEAALLDFEATRAAWEELAQWYETQLRTKPIAHF
jgi:hypothetical protein